LDSSAHGWVRRWLSIGYFLIHLLPPDRSLPAFVDIGDSFRNDGDCALMAMPVGTTRVAIDQYDCSFVSHVLCRQSASLCRPVCERRGWWEAVVFSGFDRYWRSLWPAPTEEKMAI
jgi:hypothetical protein